MSGDGENARAPAGDPPRVHYTHAVRFAAAAAVEPVDRIRILWSEIRSGFFLFIFLLLFFFSVLNNISSSGLRLASRRV